MATSLVWQGTMPAKEHNKVPQGQRDTKKAKTGMSRTFFKAKEGAKCPLTPTDESVFNVLWLYCHCPFSYAKVLSFNDLRPLYKSLRLYIEVSLMP